MHFDVRLRQLLRRGGHFAGRFLFQALPYVTQNRQAGFRVVQHVPRIGAPGLHRLHVILETDDGVGEAVRFFLSKPRRPAALERQYDQFAYTLHHVHGARLVEHQQARPDAPHQRRYAVEALRRRPGGDALADRLLDSRQIDDALAHH